MNSDFLNPNEVLRQLKLDRNIIVADFGCGSGGWTIPLAKELEDGIVYAIDILEEPLSALRSRAKLENILNIQTIRSNVEDRNGSKLSNSSVDLVLMANLLFQIEKKEEVFAEAKRILKNKGKLLIVDWKLTASLGPEENRIPEKEVKNLAEKFGFEIEKEFEAGIYHYGLLFTKL